MPSIRSVTADEFFSLPGIGDLIAEYAVESSIAGMPQPNPNEAQYRMLEASGAFHVLVAFDGDEAIGFLTMFVSPNPHYGAIIGVAESFFVASTKRHTGAGLLLLRTAERLAQHHGAIGFLVSAPAGGKLAEVMTRSSAYAETNRVFFRRLA